MYKPFHEVPTSPTFVAPEGRPFRGYIGVYYTIWCGYKAVFTGEFDCAEWEHLEAKTKAKCHEEAKRKGWELTRAFGWICPKHKENG